MSQNIQSEAATNKKDKKTDVKSWVGFLLIGIELIAIAVVIAVICNNLV